MPAYPIPGDQAPPFSPRGPEAQGRRRGNRGETAAASEHGFAHTGGKFKRFGQIPAGCDVS
ncbi:hypothetical protein BV133_584 [Blastochloris viridis]|uniref:Uncharacterized protein n=1 Tax=Blastochloris viridis TaxID=1079 RepID=A0A182CZF6_BLAVI|nr:hypothetical protein BV133_584 [Blastochloris viridis]